MMSAEQIALFAGGARVHNDSDLSLLLAAQQFEELYGRPIESLEELMAANMRGEISAYPNYSAMIADERLTNVGFDGLMEYMASTAERNGFTGPLEESMPGLLSRGREHNVRL